MSRPPHIAKVELAPKQNQLALLTKQGLALHQQGRFTEAQCIYEQALKIQPSHFDILQLFGLLLAQNGQYVKAIDYLDQALQVDPNSAACHCNRGIALKELKRFGEALESYAKVISINPHHADAYYNRGVVLQELKCFSEALESYSKVISINPHHADAYYSRGVVLQELKRFGEALASYDQAITLQPNFDYLFGRILHLKMQMCIWDDFTTTQERLVQKLNDHSKIIEPWFLNSLSNNPAIEQRCAENYTLHKYPANLALGPIPKRARGKKIRLGYYSADYYEHPCAYLLARFFESCDKAQFELIAFSFGIEGSYQMRSRLSKAFDRFIDVRLQSDQEVAQLSRDLGIDIAIDLNGYTRDARPDIFAYRAAPVQISYLGFPGTLGANYIDYIIADLTLIPSCLQPYYLEKVVYLPYSYQVNDQGQLIADKPFTRSDIGLPDHSFVFACFNNNYKILPSTFASWMTILKKVEGSVLWLLEDNPWAKEQLQAQAIKSGVKADRLVFSQRIVLEEHLSRSRQADLFLDTFPYNAHATASNALWAGLPVLTLMGETFGSRVAASLLNAIALPELITTTQEEYEALAIELANNPKKLAIIKQKLSANRFSMPLFNTLLFTDHLQQAYLQIMERYWNDLPPDHIYIKA